MSDDVMKTAIVSMLPKGAAWEIAPNGDLDHLLDGIADGLETTREDVGSVGDVRNPLTTLLLSDLETDYGIVPESDISEATRRAYLNSIKNERPKTGSDDHLEAALIAAGFNVLVIRNDPPVDPASILMGEPIATCGDPTKTCGDADTRCGMTGDGELLVNGDSVTTQEPLYTATCGDAETTCGDADTTCGAFDSMRREYYNYPIPTNPARWPYFFWIAGGIDGLDDLIDWNMEMYGAENWPAGGGANVQKSMSVVNSGIRSLQVGAGDGDILDQQTQPANPDADLQSFYRMDDVGAGVVENLAWKNELVDGNMEKPGTDVIVDGDMEVTGPDVIADGDMEVTGPDVITDGDMEAVGVAAWTAGNGATLTKDVTNPHGGVKALRIARNGANNPYASQVILTIGKTYRAIGWARGDGATGVPLLKDSSGAVLWTGTNSTSYQEFDVVFVAAGTGLWLYSNCSAGTDFVQFDDVEVTDETVACAAWTVALNALLSKQEDPYEGAQCLRVEYNGTANCIAYQTILTVGKTYRIRGWARGDGTVHPQLQDNTGACVWTGTSSTAWQEFDIVDIAGGVNLYLRMIGASGYVEFDDIEVIDETVACAAWTVGNAALLSKYGDAYEALQCMRVEYDGTDYPFASQTILTVGKTYRARGWARGDAGNGSPQMGSGGIVFWTGTTSTDYQYFDVTFIATNAVLLFLKSTTGAGHVEFDDVFVIDLDAAAADYTNAGNTTGAKRPESPVSGGQCLRVTNGGTLDYVKPAVDVLVIGNDFHITGYARGSGTAFPWLRDGGGANIWAGTSSTDWQEIDITITAGAVDLRFMANSINDYAEFDQMIVNAVPGGVATLGADASHVNGVNVTTPWIHGIEFNGVDAKIDAGAANLPMASENMTMITWVNFADYTAPATQGLITNGSVGVTRQGLYLDAGLIRYACVSGGAAKIVDAALTLSYQSTWRCRLGVTRSYDGGETILKLFFNGVVMDTLTFRGAPDVTLTQAWIGWLTGASFLNATIADNASMFNSAKSEAYMLADYEDGIGTMLEGPYAEQIVDPITTERPLDGFAWGDVEIGTSTIPMIFVLDTDTGDWNPAWIGVTGATKQTISETLDNIGGIRLYCKAATGSVFFDDISINDLVFTNAEIPSKMRDKFRKLVLKAKRLGTYAGLLINWTGDAP